MANGNDVGRPAQDAEGRRIRPPSPHAIDPPLQLDWHPCPSASFPNRSSTASPPARWWSDPQRGEGTGRERDRCRREPDRRLHRRRRTAPDRRCRQRQRHDAPTNSRSRSNAMPPPSSTTSDLLQSRPWAFAARRCPRSARWPGFDRDATRRRAACLAHTVEGGEKSAVAPGALSKGTRVEVRELFYATPARLKFLKTERTEAQAIHEVVQRLGDGAARHRLHAGRRGARAGDLGRGATAGRTPDAARRYHGSDFRAMQSRCVRARGRHGRRLCRLARPDARQRARAIPLRQWPASARQADPRRGARGLCRLSAARPASGGGAVRVLRRARGRRQRASRQDRSTLPQRWPRTRR